MHNDLQHDIALSVKTVSVMWNESAYLQHKMLHRYDMKMGKTVAYPWPRMSLICCGLWNISGTLKMVTLDEVQRIRRVNQHLNYAVAIEIKVTKLQPKLTFSAFEMFTIRNNQFPQIFPKIMWKCKCFYWTGFLWRIMLGR